MSENFIVLRRTAEEKKVFGGDVYVDIDSKNIGILGETDLVLGLENGEHTLKMYKSHKMGTFIGIAESRFTILEGEKLFARYSSPMMVNQSGTIIISKFESPYQLEKISQEVSQNITSDYHELETEKVKREEESKKNNTNLIIWIVVVPIVIMIIYWIIEMSYIDSVFP